MMKIKRIDELFQEVDSRYALVNAVAERARAIADAADDEGDILIRKPVLIAIDELSKGQTRIVRSDSEEAIMAKIAAQKAAEVKEEEQAIDFSEEDEDEDEEENFDEAEEQPEE